MRKHSLAAGLFCLLTFVSIPTLALYRGVRAPGFVTGAGPDGPVILGALLLVASWLAILLGVIEAVSPVAALAALPIAVWEFSLGVYLTIRGFRAVPILSGPEPS